MAKKIGRRVRGTEWKSRTEWAVVTDNDITIDKVEYLRAFTEDTKQMYQDMGYQIVSIEYGNTERKRRPVKVSLTATTKEVKFFDDYSEAKAFSKAV